MTKQTISAHLVEVWPALKGKHWPSELGSQPTANDVKVALTAARPNTAVAMALAMYARASGSTDQLAATAASLATGSTSATHRVKRDMLVTAGSLAKAIVGHVEGHQVTRISLPSKAGPTAPTKATNKRTSKAKGKGTKATPKHASKARKAPNKAKRTGKAKRK